MRTKTLLVMAAISAAGVATSMAQVYSQNAVGYINKTVQKGFNLFINQLSQTNQTLDGLLPSVPEDTTVYMFTGGSFQIRQFTGGGWDPAGDLVLGAGRGFFLLNQSGSAFTMTLVGEVPQGTLTVPVGNGLNLIGSIVPQGGLISTALGFPLEEDDSCYQFKNDGITPASFVINQVAGGAWDPIEPDLSVGEGFWLQSNGAHASWVRTFTVN